jgi:hypothetical protein
MQRRWKDDPIDCQGTRLTRKVQSIDTTCRLMNRATNPIEQRHRALDHEESMKGSGTTLDIPSAGVGSRVYVLKSVQRHR